MTLVVAFRYGRGVVMASDSRSVLGPTAEEVRKLRPVYLIAKGGREVHLAVAGGSGDGAVVKQSYRDVETAFREFYRQRGRHPRGEEVYDVAEEIQQRLLTRYQALKSLGYEPEASLIVSTVTGDGSPHIFQYSNGVLNDRSEDGYAMAGLGRDTGGVLLLSLLGYRPDAEWDMGLLTFFLIDAISLANPYVSPLTTEVDNFYIRWQDGEVVMGPLKPESFREYKERVKKRIQLIRTLWQLAETIGEDKIEKALTKEEKTAEK